jgi:hypothetical protein
MDREDAFLNPNRPRQVLRVQQEDAARPMHDVVEISVFPLKIVTRPPTLPPKGAKGSFRLLLPLRTSSPLLNDLRWVIPDPNRNRKPRADQDARDECRMPWR